MPRYVEKIKKKLRNPNSQFIIANKVEKLNELETTKKSFSYEKDFILGGRRDSNPRPSVPQTDTLTN